MSHFSALALSGEMAYITTHTANTVLIFTAPTYVGREVVRPSLAAMAPNILLCEILDLHGAFRALLLWFSSLDLTNNDDGDVCACFSCADVP